MKQIPADIKSAVMKLLTLCKEHDISISGAMESTDNQLNNFSYLSDHESKSEEFHHIQTLNKAKGELGLFLCELSKIENQTTNFKCGNSIESTNPQIKSTIH